MRFTGSTNTQIIQNDDQGYPLYASAGCLSENRNLDICVADGDANAVVVVSAAGKLRFRYTGLPTITTREPFTPYGITTDSKCNILIAHGLWHHCIHIIDLDDNFLCFIDSCGIQFPKGLCVDSRDNLFVAEYASRKVKKLQSYK